MSRKKKKLVQIRRAPQRYVHVQYYDFNYKAILVNKHFGGYENLFVEIQRVNVYCLNKILKVEFIKN